MPGRASGQKEQWIFFTDRIGFQDLMKKCFGISKLRFELATHLRAHLITAVVHPGADCGLQVPWQTSKAAAHFANAFFGNALNCAAPSCVKYANGAEFHVRQDYGETVSGLNCQQDSRSCRDHAISGKRVIHGAAYEVNEVGMKLAQRDQRPSFPAFDGAKLLEEGGAVALNSSTRIFFGEPEIQGITAVGTGSPPPAGGKTMDQPGKMFERSSLEYGDFRLLRAIGRHNNILTATSGGA